MIRCRRCDFQPQTNNGPDREQLADHARQAAHPLCVVCTRSLAAEETQTCETCLTAARSLLTGVVTMWAELPDHLGQIRGATYDTDRPSASDGRALPGGDVLVLLGPGSQGLSEDSTTTKDGDTTSVAWELGWWERDWRDAREEDPGAWGRGVQRSAGYLERRTRWAASSHLGFDTYVADLRVLHGRLERATGRAERTVRAEAECFGCGADALVRQSRPAGQCEHEQPSQELLTVIPLKTETPAQRDARQAAWAEEHSRCEQGGYENYWTCERCHETYDWQRYLLAIRGRLQEADDDEWGLPEQVAYTVGVRPNTVWQWVQRGLVTALCHVQTDRRVRVSWVEAHVRGEALEQTRAKARERRDTQSRDVA